MTEKSIIINPKKLKGIVNVPPSKSLSHRGIICAGLCADRSVVENLIYSEDILTTIEAMKQFGMTVIKEEVQKDRYRLVLQNPKMKTFDETNQKLIDQPVEIMCNESGTTIRFLMPFFALSSAPMTFKGKGRLGERPYETFYKILREKGVHYETTEGLLPVTIKGALTPGTFEMAGNVSSQFISGLMLLLPLLNADSSIVLSTKLESKGYVDLTLDAMRQYGVQIENVNDSVFNIKGKQQYQGTKYFVEGDYSQAAFWLVAGCLGNEVFLEGMQDESLQGDRAIIEIIQKMGGKVTVVEGIMTAQEKTHNQDLNHTVVDASQCPDLVPVVAVLLSMAKGTSEIINAGRLRIKESDRLLAICTELNKMGARITEKPEGLVIEGIDHFIGAKVDSWNDHRIAMAIAIATTRAIGAVELTGFEAVKKSYPMFWEDYAKLGGEVHG